MIWQNSIAQNISASFPYCIKMLTVSAIEGELLSFTSVETVTQEKKVNKWHNLITLWLSCTWIVDKCRYRKHSSVCVTIDSYGQLQTLLQPSILMSLMDSWKDHIPDSSLLSIQWPSFIEYSIKSILVTQWITKWKTTKPTGIWNIPRSDK